MQKRILIVDDSDSTRGSVREFLESRPDFEVCGEAADGFEGVQRVLELKPDVIILDFSMPRIHRLQAALVMREMMPDTPIILFTIHNDGTIVQLAHNAGIASVISKSDQLTTLADEVQRLTMSPN